MKLRSTVLLAVISLVFVSLLGIAQAQVGPPAGRRGMMQQGQGTVPGTMQQDPVARLNRALESAGATPLTDAQKNELTTLVNNFRSAHQPTGPDQSMMQAKKDLEAAILSGKPESVDGPANAIAARISQRTAAMIRDSATLQIQVLGLLDPQQVAALRTQFGNSGLMMTLGSLAGGFHRGFGGGMRRGWK